MWSETVDDRPRRRVFQTPSVISLIGQTPLVPLARVAGDVSPAVDLYVQLEGFNPGGSVKDRAALSIVQEALRTGELGSKTLIDATSGNTGISFAMLGATFGFPVELVMPADASPERVQTLKAYGAKLVLSDPAGRTDGAREVARQMVTAEPDRYFYADQYNNPANPLAHYTTTGPEIWQQTAGRVTHFVAGMGTSGTMMGTGRYLRERNPAVQLVGVQPTSSERSIPGLKHLATAEDLDIYDPHLVDETAVVDVDQAKAMARRLAREEGFFVGVSAGAAVVAALGVAQKLAEGTFVALLPDGGFKYASAPFWVE
jgi:cysteine synthase B